MTCDRKSVVIDDIKHIITVPFHFAGIDLIILFGAVLRGDASVCGKPRFESANELLGIITVANSEHGYCIGKQIVRKMKMEVAAYERDHVVKQA